MTDLSLARGSAVSPRRRVKRAQALDPTDPKTWHEADLQTRLKERRRLGGGVAWHLRKQGDRANGGDERPGAKRAGILEAVPADAAWSLLDWICIPPSTADNVLWLE